jgi:hypothetical protein
MFAEASSRRQGLVAGAANVRFVRKILGSSLPVVVAMALAFGAVAATGLVVGRVRHSQDEAWCRKATPTVLTLKGQPQPVPPAELAQARAACVAERRAQRGLLGAVWKTGGAEMADCGVDWGRYQQLSDTDPDGASATVVAPYGITAPLDSGSRSDEQRFINACLAKKRSH